MKFKYLIIAFSIIIVIIIFITFFLPSQLSAVSFTEGSGSVEASILSAVNFKYIIFPLLVFIALLLVCVSLYFIFNYRLLSLLEKEDWPALAYYLEQQIYTKSRYSGRNVRLLASSYLVISDYKSVIKLESKVHMAKPSLISQNALVFGAARILDGNHQEAVSFYRSNLEKCIKTDKEWVRWFSGFSELLAGLYPAAEAEFSHMAVSSKDAIISGLSAYFLNNHLKKKSFISEKCLKVSETGRERVIKALKTEAGWNKEVKKAGNDIHIAIIRKYVEEAGKWIFPAV